MELMTEYIFFLTAGLFTRGKRTICAGEWSLLVDIRVGDRY